MEKHHINILLVDDHEVVRRGFKALINLEAELLVTAEAANLQEAKTLLSALRFDLLITDLSLPDGSGCELLQFVSLHEIPLKSIVFSIYDREPYISEALNNGANGYLSKRTASDDIINAIRQVLAGQSVLSSDVLVNFSNNARKRSTDNIVKLTSREHEIFLLLAKGKLVKEVARLLDIMPKTAHSHRRNIFEKLNCTSSFELTQIALRGGYIKQTDLI